MGNLLETCMQRGGNQKQQENGDKMDGSERDYSCEEIVSDSEKGDCGNKLRIKVVLRKQDLQWLAMHCREISNGGGVQAVEELLRQIQNKSGIDNRVGSWRPALDSIMEMPELQFVES